MAALVWTDVGGVLALGMTGMPSLTICCPVPLSALLLRLVPPSSRLFWPLPNAVASDVFSEMYLDVFTTEIENSTMNSTSSSVSMSA